MTSLLLEDTTAASLKNAIDGYGEAWEATPVGFISYGGRTGGIEAVEQPRTVFVELSWWAHALPAAKVGGTQ